MYSPNSISNTFICLAQSAQKTILVAPAPVEEANQDPGIEYKPLVGRRVRVHSTQGDIEASMSSRAA